MMCLPGKHVWIRDMHYKGAGVKYDCKQCSKTKYTK